MPVHKGLHSKRTIDFLLHIWLIFSSFPHHLQIKSKPSHQCITNIVGCRVHSSLELLPIKAGTKWKDNTKLHLLINIIALTPAQCRWHSKARKVLQQKKDNKNCHVHRPDHTTWGSLQQKQNAKKNSIQHRKDIQSNDHCYHGSYEAQLK